MKKSKKNKMTLLNSIFFFLFFLLRFSTASPPVPRGYLLNCGATDSAAKTTVGNLQYITDEGFISVGNTTKLHDPNLVPILSTLRYFPDKSARKYCYEIPVVKGGKYIVRTTYYYGGYDGGKVPPVFDQIVEGTKWSTVNTTEDYANGMSSYYEVVAVAMGKMMSVCLARNQHTDSSSSPFISALELESLEDSVYNTTDFKNHALSLVARTSFGHDVDVIGFPDDAFNRQWHPFVDENPLVTCHANVTPSTFWNLPPAKAFNTAITTSRGKLLKINWPPFPLPAAYYYISLYFQDNRSPSPYSWRVFNVAINGKNFFTNLNVTANGVSVSSPRWPLYGQTHIELTPADDMPVGPVINAAEILQVFRLGGRTLTRDVMTMVDLARSFNNPPHDWSGDPCLPKENSWTGVTCSDGKLARVVNLNLTNFGLSGTLPSSINNLTALSHLWLGSNKLSGSIPEMGSLKELQTLHLEKNQFEGPIPHSLSKLPHIREIFLQNNDLKSKALQALQKLGIHVEL
ncbi:probable LRR receptor-like serine/threonine-protein kinase At1g67720 [Benincasa hispida]|uniref:probable LRR receptor-like serine/threonine-protein kinase At1g67720 n=1 Tax=Benincasa hispida TaxID=102211 RepID=UPI0019029FBB|nr:probable LRR receptor-like serine/threonine-protein kinase At1g67720 [Benincasa hispida]